jgi:hypothetical protein
MAFILSNIDTGNVSIKICEKSGWGCPSSGKLLGSNPSIPKNKLIKIKIPFVTR